MKKDHNSPEYFAQGFRDYLVSPLLKGGIGFRAKQRGSAVEFRVSDIDCRVSFSFKKGELFSKISLARQDNQEEFEIAADIKRSASGRISGGRMQSIKLKQRDSEYLDKIVLDNSGESFTPGYHDFYDNLMKAIKNFYHKTK